ncbi:MAG: helix-turn-helix domain-containing protein [Acidobacteria bacterium]|nr:helix-turn-helix domain-containing protein [Acidobacteriota bacterium]
MKTPTRQKRRYLEEAGLLHRNPEQVRYPLFIEQPEFFDSHDLLQVRYEALRAHLVDGEDIVGLSRRFSFSRQTFYTLLEKFSRQGSRGLLPERPGPKGPSKLSGDILSFTRREYDREPEIAGAALASRIESKFRISIHKRTIEKLLAELRSKKNF